MNVHSSCPATRSGSALSPALDAPFSRGWTKSNDRMSVLESLIAQWRRCGGDKCKRAKCPRCERGLRITMARTQKEGS